MPIIELQLRINAPKELVFDLSRSVDLHKVSTSETNEEAIAGKTSGLMTLNHCHPTKKACVFLDSCKNTIAEI